MILAYDVLNHVEIYRGENPAHANSAIADYCNFMGIDENTQAIRIEVIS